MKPPISTRRMKNSYSDRSSAEDEMLIGRWMSFSGPMRPSVAYWPGAKPNGSSSDCTPTMARPGATSSHRLMRPLYGYSADMDPSAGRARTLRGGRGRQV